MKENRLGGDDAIRPAFPDSPARLAPFGWGVYRLHQELIGLRRRHPWLQRAQTRIAYLSNARITFEVFSESRRLVVALNLEGAGDQPTPWASRLLAGRGTVAGASTAHATIRLEDRGWAILAPDGV